MILIILKKKENISELILFNYNCSTEPLYDLNITEGNTQIEYIELANKEEENYFDISNVNISANKNKISNNESTFNIDNLTNYAIFTCHEKKIINLTNDISFTLEGKTNRELTKDINLVLSLNNINDFYMNCVFSSKFMDNSSLYCSFNISNFKTIDDINIYYIRENEINANDITIYFVGLKKALFIYEKKIEINIEKGESEKKKNNIILIIIIIAIIALIGILIAIIIIVRKRKTKESKTNNKHTDNKKKKFVEVNRIDIKSIKDFSISND